jgi:AbrB family looped-hinge helix DNA binding protein
MKLIIYEFMKIQQKTKSETLVKVSGHHQITLPSDLRKRLNIKNGDYLKIVESDDSCISIKPVKVIDADQAYFYTKEWQKGEKQADIDYANGDISRPFNSVDELMKELNS